MPFAVLFILLVMFAVGGMLVVAHEADRSDAARAREAVARTFEATMARLGSAAEMNAAAPPIASALSGARATPASAHAYLNFTSSEALGYYGVVVLNHDGSAFAGTYSGRAWSGPGLAAAAHLVAPVAARLPAAGPATVHAIRRDAQGRALAIAVSNVVPGPRDTAVDSVGQLRRLAVIAPVGVQLVPKIVPSLGVEDFRIVAALRNDNQVAIPVEDGAPIIFAWRPHTPGRAAIARWAPAIGTMLVAALVMLALTLRSNMATTRALQLLANHDSLTGLANRSAFRAELDRRLERGETVVLGMIDLNGFKAVNDLHGHLVGDELLQRVAAELVQSVRPGDFVARLGGDEFGWIGPSDDAARRFAAEFYARIAHPLPVGNASLEIGASMGITLAQPGMAVGALVATADARLYESKAASRARRPVGLPMLPLEPVEQH